MGASLPPYSGASSYFGQVANKSYIPASLATWANTIGTWSHHRAADDISAIRLCYPNWYGTTGGEAAPGGTNVVTSSVEYPIGSGSPKQITTSGGASLTIADGATGQTDLVVLGFTIPRGAWFRVRTFATGTGATFMMFGDYDGQIDRSEFGNGMTDKTMSGTIAAGSGTISGYGPVAIVGRTKLPSIALCGDSIMRGLMDSYDDLSGDIGIVARSLAPYFGTMNLGLSGDKLTSFVGTGGSRRRALSLAYATHVVSSYMINDLTSGRTATQILADFATLAGQLSGKLLFSTTCTPVTTSTDAWATVANQSVVASNANRLTVNRNVRGVLPGFLGYFDVAEVLESGHDSGKWDLLKGGGASTADGTHPVMAANVAVRRSGTINPAAITR